MDSRCWALVGSLALIACGEASEDGTPASANNANEQGTTAGEPTPAEPISLADWLWALSGPGASSNMLTAEAGVLTLTFPAGAERLQMQTHHHFDMLGTYSAISFDATANRPTTLLVAFTETPESTGTYYWDDLAAGSPWLAAPVEIGSTQQHHVVSFDSLAPQGPGTPRATYGAGLGGTAIWFLFEDATSLELELANITLE
jgi:hypothetical protein